MSPGDSCLITFRSTFHLGCGTGVFDWSVYISSRAEAKSVRERMGSGSLGDQAVAMEDFSVHVLAWAIIKKYHTLSGLNNRLIYLFIYHSRGWEVQDQVLTDLISGEVSLPGLQMATFSLCASMTERDRESRERQRDREREGKLSVVSSYKGTNSSMRAPPP